jgi:hypothetical protein
MLEELVALALIEDRRRKLDSVILVARIRPVAPAVATRRQRLAERLALWLQPREWAAVVPHEARVEAEAWRLQ